VHKISSLNDGCQYKENERSGHDPGAVVVVVVVVVVVAVVVHPP